MNTLSLPLIFLNDYNWFCNAENNFSHLFSKHVRLNILYREFNFKAERFHLGERWQD